MSKKNKPPKNVQETPSENTVRHKKSKKLSAKKSPKQFYYSKTLMGVFIQTSDTTGYVTAASRKGNFPDIMLTEHNMKALKHLDVVIFSLKRGFEVEEILGSIHTKDLYTKMAIWESEIPHVFSKSVIDQSQDASKKSFKLSKSHMDLTDIPFVTVDGEDAKDFDDAIYAAPLENGGWEIIVAIADVSYFVDPDSAIDREALRRGNSVYFPNAVIPMLPFELSDDVCSLKPNEDRLVLAVKIQINPEGGIVGYQFKRGVICSRARLTYEQVQNEIDTGTEEACQHLKPQIAHLYSAYKILDQARQTRGTLEISMPEYKVAFNTKGMPSKMTTYQERESNKIIEEFMILANVCAANALLKQKCQSIFRNHDMPDQKRYGNMIKIIKSFGHKVPKDGKLTPHTFNYILSQDTKPEYKDLVQELVLRCQAQANYAVKNTGHFGLSLKYYTHFTSPIRRYADLMVHRSLINVLKLDTTSYPLPSGDGLALIADHISKTERTAMNAERLAKERYALSILIKDIGKTVKARISGIIERGFFVQILGTCAEGFIPLIDLDDDYYKFDSENQRLIGRKKKKTYQLGQAIKVEIISVYPLLTKLVLKIVR